MEVVREEDMEAEILSDKRVSQVWDMIKKMSGRGNSRREGPVTGGP